ncbi:MAG TPA: hypothetical protein VH601_25875, partial [Bryobacteraceae bacterium]
GQSRLDCRACATSPRALLLYCQLPLLWFDELERTWDARAAKAEAEAVTLRKQGRMEKAAKALAALTAACIEEAVAAVEQVKAHLTSASGERPKAVTGSE